MFILSIIAKTILYSMGWSRMSEETLTNLNKQDKLIGIFSHTTYADFFIFILYKLSYPDRMNHIITLVKPQPFKYFGFILRRLGAIHSTPVDKKSGNAVDRIVETLSSNPKFLFLISPKGTISLRSWRSGYYHIARESHADFVVTGLDYESKTSYCSKVIKFSDNQSEIDEQLVKELSLMVPLYPENEIVEIRKHNPSKISIINKYRIFSVLILYGLSSIYLSKLGALGLVIVFCNSLF